MSYDDFLKHFDILEICNLSFELLTDEQIIFLKRKFSLNQFRGEWVAGVSAGGCDDPEKFYRNPQYIIHLRTPDHDSGDGKCSVVIALMQNNRKIKKEGLELLYIGFNMYSLSESDLKQKPFRKDFFERKENLTDGMTFVDLHEMSARFKLLPGYYLIVPATFDVNEEGEFLIRVFTEHESKFKEHDEAAEIGEVDSTVNTLEYMFLCAKLLIYRLLSIFRISISHLIIGCKLRNSSMTLLMIGKKLAGRN